MVMGLICGGYSSGMVIKGVASQSKDAAVEAFKVSLAPSLVIQTILTERYKIFATMVRGV